MVVLFVPQCKSSIVSIIQLKTLGVQVSQLKQKIGKWITWEAANNCQFTLNTYGSSRVGVCSGVGIVRDQNGAMIYAFFNYYCNGTNMEGEVLALNVGLAIYRGKCYISVHVQTDSKIAVDFLNHQAQIPWRLEYSQRECSSLLGGPFCVQLKSNLSES